MNKVVAVSGGPTGCPLSGRSDNGEEQATKAGKAPEETPEECRFGGLFSEGYGAAHRQDFKANFSYKTKNLLRRGEGGQGEFLFSINLRGNSLT